MNFLEADNNINSQNTTSEYDINNISLLETLNLVEKTKIFKAFASLFVILIGLVGHCLTISVFARKRFRKNPNNVISLCLAVNDSLFLVIHFFEDTVVCFKEIYFSDITHRSEKLGHIIQLLNLIDENELTCRLINYLRYVLRFVSAYIFVVFTIQRLLIVYSPLQNKFKSKKSSWITVLAITVASFLLNAWALFVFGIKQENREKFCDVNSNWKLEYFRLNAIYICSIILVPIITIVFSNTLIILKIINKNLKRKRLQSFTKHENIPILELQRATRTKSISSHLRMPLSRMQSADFKTKTLTKRLILISFTYAILNLPYLITWLTFFSMQTLHTSETKSKAYIYSVVQVSEIFYILNFSLHFYLCCISGSLFRNQLKNLAASKKYQLN